MTPGDRELTRRFWSALPFRALAPLLAAVFETMDRQDRELVLDPIESALLSHASEPLPALFERLLGIASAHGPQQDDRTLLLVRIR